MELAPKNAKMPLGRQSSLVLRFPDLDVIYKLADVHTLVQMAESASQGAVYGSHSVKIGRKQNQTPFPLAQSGMDIEDMGLKQGGRGSE